jgi:hypothetical protein
MLGSIYRPQLVPWKRYGRENNFGKCIPSFVGGIISDRLSKYFMLHNSCPSVISSQVGGDPYKDAVLFTPLPDGPLCLVTGMLLAIGGVERIESGSAASILGASGSVGPYLSATSFITKSNVIALRTLRSRHIKLPHTCLDTFLATGEESLEV